MRHIFIYLYYEMVFVRNINSVNKQPPIEKKNALITTNIRRNLKMLQLGNQTRDL